MRKYLSMNVPSACPKPLSIMRRTAIGRESEINAAQVSARTAHIVSPR